MQEILTWIKHYKMNASRTIGHDIGFNLSEVAFMADLKMADLNSFIKITSEICTQCRTNRKTHYCVEPNCFKHELVCWQCDCSKIGSKHFMHQYTFALPLFCESIMDNFQSIRRNLEKFSSFLLEQITKMKEYLQKMCRIHEMTQRSLGSLDEEYKRSNFAQFKKKTEQFAKIQQQIGTKGYSKKLDQLLKQVKFYSADQCVEKQQKLFNTLLKKVNELKWLNDPQKDLKQLLTLKEHEKKDVFLGSNKKLQFSEIDQNFKVNNEFYTQNLKTHKIELKVEPDFLNKSKFYEALVYHLKDVEILSIENAHMNQIRSPLTFRNLRELEFNCNNESDPITLRIDDVTDRLQSLTIRKLRDQDIKNLKSILQLCPQNLKQINLEMANKYDLCYSKDLAQSILLCMKFSNLSTFSIKIRTESEAKRIHGYLCKFYKDSPLSAASSSPDLSNSLTLSTSPLVLAFQQFFRKSKKLNKIVIQGIKSMVNLQLLQSMQTMPNLMSYRVYHDNIDLMSDLNPERNKILQKECQIRKNTIYALAKNDKFKLINNKQIDQLVKNFLI